MKEFWDKRYVADTYAYGKEPNVFFASQLQYLAPGKILFLAEGEGRNASFAAKLGWDVTAVDFSEEAKKKALKLATEMGVMMKYEISEIEKFDFPIEYFDAIVLVYAHFSANFRENIHQSCVSSLKTNGLIILEAFNPKQLNNTSGGPKDVSMLYTLEILRNDFKDLKIKYLEEAKTTLSEGFFHIGDADVIRLIAQK